MKIKANNKITLNSKTYLSVNRGVFNNEILDRDDFVRMNNRTYWAAIAPSKIHADRKLVSI